jgi:site-specific DNA-methyltransferase (adenine-specific)
MARAVLAALDLSEIEEEVRISPGVTLSARARTSEGATHHFEFAGVHTPARAGVARIEHVWKSIAKSAVLRSTDPEAQLIVLTSGTVRGGPLAAVTGPDRPIRAVVDLTRDDAVEKLSTLLDIPVFDPPND